MKRLVRSLWRDHRPVLIAFTLAVLLTLFFAGRMIVFTFYWSDPTHHMADPEGWMTPRYVARSWNLPRDALIEGLNLPPPSGHPPTLQEIADQRGQPLSDLLDEVRAIIAAQAEKK